MAAQRYPCSAIWRMAKLASEIGSSTTTSAGPPQQHPHHQQPSSDLAAVIEAHYSASNPIFQEAGERTIVPVQARTVELHGQPPGPKDRVIQVARYGRVYKRKSPWQNFTKIKKATPPGMRYCKFCDAFLPLRDRKSVV